MATNEKQTITFATLPTGGYVTITIGAVTTDQITDFSAAGLQAAIAAADLIYSGKVTVDLVGEVYTVTFDASLGDVDQLTVDASQATVAVEGTITQVQAAADETSVSVTPTLTPVGDGSGSAEILFDVEANGGVLTLNFNGTSCDLDPSMDATAITNAVAFASTGSFGGSGDFASGEIFLLDNFGSNPAPTISSSSLKSISAPGVKQIVVIDLDGAISGGQNFAVDASYYNFNAGDSSMAVSGYDVVIFGNQATFVAQASGLANSHVFSDQGSTLTKSADAPDVETDQDGSAGGGDGGDDDVEAAFALLLRL